MKRFLLFFLIALGFAAHAQAQTPTLSISDATTIEGNSRYRELLFPVTLSKAQSFDVSASYSTKPITAQPDSDYVPQSAGQVVIKAGQTKANILIRVMGDTIEEPSESFLVQLGAPKRATISDSDGIGSVTDDDYNGQIAINDTSFTELNSGLKVAKLLISFSKAPLHDVSVTYETKDEGAKAPGDYITTKGTLIFRPGRLVLTVAVPIVGDTLFEGNERCFVKISATGIPITKNVGYITILNDDGDKPSGRIVYTNGGAEDRGILSVKADGTGKVGLAGANEGDNEEDHGAILNPNGSKIAFVSDRNGNEEIYLMDANGANIKRLTDTPFSDEKYDLRWSRDGSKITFMSPLNDGGNQVGADDENQVFIVNADGSGQKQLTYIDGVIDNPQFSADGTRVFFSCDKDDGREDVDDLYSMNLASGDIRNLTNNVEVQGYVDIHNFAPSPDGSFIAFDQRIYIDGPNGGPTEQILSINPNGGDLRLLANILDAYHETFTFNADGSMLLFLGAVSESEGGRTNVQLMTMSTLEIRRVTNFEDVYGATFSPDQKYLAFATDDKIFTLNISDGTSRAIADVSHFSDVSDESPLSWGPDFAKASSAVIPQSSSAPSS